MDFRIRPVATFRIARNTQRDSDQWGKGVTQHRNFAPGGRLVTAGDGNMVRVGHIGHQRRASNGAEQPSRIAVPVQEEGRTHVCTNTRSGTASDAAEVATMFRVDPKPSRVGLGGQADVNPDAGWPPSVQGNRRSVPCWPGSRSSVRVDRVHLAPEGIRQPAAALAAANERQARGSAPVAGAPRRGVVDGIRRTGVSSDVAGVGRNRLSRRCRCGCLAVAAAGAVGGRYRLLSLARHLRPRGCRQCQITPGTRWKSRGGSRGSCSGSRRKKRGSPAASAPALSCLASVSVFCGWPGLVRGRICQYLAGE
jgi:hypothetical protein